MHVQASSGRGLSSECQGFAPDDLHFFPSTTANFFATGRLDGSSKLLENAAMLGTRGKE
jgi:hypothetical protein